MKLLPILINAYIHTYTHNKTKQKPYNYFSNLNEEKKSNIKQNQCSRCDLNKANKCEEEKNRLGNHYWKKKQPAFRNFSLWKRYCFLIFRCFSSHTYISIKWLYNFCLHIDCVRTFMYGCKWDEERECECNA